MGLSEIFSWIVSPITNQIDKYQDRKQAQESAKSKLQQAKLDGNYSLQLSELEWESIAKQTEGDSWKDELVTLVFVSPIILIFLAAILSAYTGNTAYIEAVNSGVEAVKSLLNDDSTFGELLYIITLAAVGIKATKRML